MLLPAGEFCSGLEQREQATGTEGTVKMSIGMSGSKVPRERHLVVGLLECPYHQKGKVKDFFSYFTDAYPLAKSFWLQRFKVSSETNQALGTLLHCIHMFMKTILAYKHGPTGSIGKMTSKLHSAVTQRPMIYVLQTLHGCEKEESPISGMKWSWQEFLRNKCTTVAAVKDDKKMIKRWNRFQQKWKDHGLISKQSNPWGLGQGRFIFFWVEQIKCWGKW